MTSEIVRVRVAAALLLSACLAGCVTSGSSPMDARAEAVRPPARTYMPVEDMPDPKGPALTNDEQSKLKKELSDTRDRQAAIAKARNAPAETAKSQ